MIAEGCRITVDMTDCIITCNNGYGLAVCENAKFSAKKCTSEENGGCVGAVRSGGVLTAEQCSSYKNKHGFHAGEQGCMILLAGCRALYDKAVM